MSEKQIKHMVDRFLSWTLPTDLDPDAGISFDGSGRPSGTNLLTATQAEKMVWHMLEDLPVETDTMLERYLALADELADKASAERGSSMVWALRYVERRLREIAEGKKHERN